MAVNMNPTRSALATPRAGSLLMRPTQVASVNDVKEPEDTLASVTAVAPSIEPQQEPEVTPQEPEVSTDVPEVQGSPAEEVDPLPLPEPTGIQMADDETSRQVIESLSKGKTDSDSVVDPSTVELDFEHPWFKEEAKRKQQDRKFEAAQGLSELPKVKRGMTAEDIKKEADKYDVPAVEIDAEEQYEALGNRLQRSFFGVIETPRYLASIPGLTSRVVESSAKDSDSQVFKAAAGAYAAATSFMMDALISKAVGANVPVKDVYKQIIVDPVVDGKTVDQKFENDLLSSIKKRTGVTLSQDYLEEQSYWEAGEDTAVTFGLGGLFNAVRQGTKVISKKMVANVSGESVKGATTGVASVWGSNTAISLIDPKSKEGQILAGMLGGGVAAPAAGALMSTTGKVAKYSPTALIIRGSKVALDKAKTMVSDVKRDQSIGKIMRVEGTDRKEAIKRYYTRLDTESPERKNLAMRLLNDTDMTNDERMEAVNSILEQALKDPLGREAEVVRTAISVIEKDKKAIEGAWTQAELLNRAFSNEQFKVDVFDVYNGKYKDSFLHLREEVAPDDILRKQSAMLEFLRQRLDKDTTMTDLERSEVTAAAIMLEKSMDESIHQTMVDMQQNVAAALDLTTETKFTQQGPLDTNVNRVRDALSNIKETAKKLLKVGYSSIDPQNKVRSSTAFSGINQYVTSLDRNNTAYKDIQKAFSSLMAESTMRYRDTTDDTSIIAGTKPNPLGKFSKTAVNKADEVVFLNPQQFEQLTGVKLKEGNVKKPLSSIASLDLEDTGDGSFAVKNISGADKYGPLGKDTLIPVSMSFDLLNSLVDRRLRIKDQTGAVVQLDLSRQLGKTGDDRHNIALLDHTIEEGRKRGNLSPENPQSSFLPKFDIEKMDLTYREMDQFQRTIRRLRKEAWNRDDSQAYLTLKELDHQLNDMIQETLKTEPDAYAQRKALDKLYGDSFVPEMEDNKSLVGKATTKNPNRTYTYAMSSLIDSMGLQVELRQQLIEVLDPENSKFVKGIANSDSAAKLDKLLGMDKVTLRKLETEGQNVASAMLDIKMSDILQNVYKNIGTNVEPRQFLIDQLKALQDSPDFAALYMASEGTETKAMIDKALALPDDADLTEVLHQFQTHIDKFDDVFYKSVRGLKDPANTKAVLDIVSNLDKFDELEASLVINGELSVAAPQMIKIVLGDVLNYGDKGFSASSIQNGINKYGNGLAQLPGGTEALQALKLLKDSQDVLDKLNGSSGKAKVVMGEGGSRTAAERGLSYLPSVFSDIKSARKGIVGMDYAVFSSITGIATKEMRALRKVESKAVSETLAAALMNKDIFEKINNVNRALGDEASPADKLKNLSLLLHSANGVRLGALEAVAGLIEQSDDTEMLLEALRNTPEFQEVEQEDLEAATPYGLREDGTPKDVGFLGELKNSDGDVMTEYSIGVNIDGKDIEIPTLVPTLTDKEKQLILDTGEITPAIKQKSVDHAMKRIKEGKSPFFDSSKDKVPELLQRPEAQLDVSPEAMKAADSNDPMHEVDNLEGPIVDGMSPDEATKTKATFKFHDLRSQGIPKEQVLKILEASGMGDNNNKSLILSALDEAYGSGE